MPGATFDSLLREALEACSVEEQPEDNSARERVKETVKIMDIPSSNTKASLVVSIDSDNNDGDENR